MNTCYQVHTVRFLRVTLSEKGCPIRLREITGQGLDYMWSDREQFPISPFWDKWKKALKIAFLPHFCNFCTLILTFEATFYIVKYCRWHYFHENCGRNAKKVQNICFEKLIFFTPNSIWGKITDFFNIHILNFMHSPHLFTIRWGNLGYCGSLHMVLKDIIGVKKRPKRAKKSYF